MEHQDNIICVGSLFTRDINSNRPYYYAEYEKNGIKCTKWIARNVSREFLSEECYNLVKTARDMEEAFPEIDAFQIDFSIDRNGKINVIRWDNLEKVANMPRIMTDKEFADTKSFAKCSYLDTNHILSDSAYWNIKSQLGTNPRPLDYSLFRELITMKAWNDSIVSMGYTGVRGELMQKVGNKPYTSVDNTFEALTPATITSELRFKLFEYYEKKLRSNRSLHRDMEKKLIFNLYDFSTEDRLGELSDNGFSTDEIKSIKQGLTDITKYILSNYHFIYEKDRESVEKMSSITRALRENLPHRETNVMKLYKYIRELLEGINMYGIPQFTRQLRCSVLAERLCESMVEKGYISEEAMKSFTDSIWTIKRKLKRDLKRYASGIMSREEFNGLYGEFRSGIFDIRTDSFENLKIEPGEFFKEKKQEDDNENDIVFLDTATVERALKESGLNISPEKLMEYIILCYKNREIIKFELTKSINLLLIIIARLGEVLGIAREDMSYLEIHELLSYHSRDSYIQTIQSRRDMYHANTYLILPDIIFDVGDIDIIGYESTPVICGENVRVRNVPTIT